MNPRILLGVGSAAALLFFLTRNGGGKAQIGLLVGDSLAEDESYAVGHPRSMGYQLMAKITAATRIPFSKVAYGGTGVKWYTTPRSGWDGMTPVQWSIRGRDNPYGRPTFLVVVLGVNDSRLGMENGRSPSGHRLGPLATREAAYKEALRKFVAQAKADGIEKIVWLGPSKIEDDPDAEERAERGLRARKHGAWLNPGAVRIAQWQKEALEPLGVEWHDSQPMTADLPTRDGIHFRERESGIWASRAATAMGL